VKNQAFPVMMTNFIDRSKKTPPSGASIPSGSSGKPGRSPNRSNYKRIRRQKTLEIRRFGNDGIRICDIGKATSTKHRMSLPSFTNVRTSLILTVVGEQILTKLASSLRIIIFVLLAAYLGCDSTSAKRQIKNEVGVVDLNEVGEAELSEIAHGSANISFGKDFALEIEKAMNAKQSIVFAHVKWAQMGVQRKFFCNFANTYRDSHPRDATSFYYIDFTKIPLNSVPLKELNGWSELRPASRVIHGNGELIWILNGKVVSVEPIMNFTLDQLVTKTETNFTSQQPLAPAE